MPIPSLRLTAAPLTEIGDADLFAVPVGTSPEGPEPGRGAVALAAAGGVDLPTVLTQEKVKGEVGEIVSVPLNLPVAGPDAGGRARRLLLVGIGDGGTLALRRAGAALARRARGGTLLATDVAAGAAAEGLRAFAEGLILGSYAFHRKSESKRPGAVESVLLVTPRPPARQGALDRAVVVGTAVWRARDLANTPSNEKSPQWLAEQAAELAHAAGLQVRIWDETALAAGGFGGIIGVGQGSARPPRLIQLGYTPAGAGPDTPHVVLVGKGITFDSGGLSLKPRDSMALMKTDMAGGGAVIATMAALPALGIGVRVTGLIAAAENLPSGSALRPGDVLVQYGGTTVEVFNTDAEGRLVLADALAYACAQLDPDALVDLATLTGAASVGLGRRHAALYATDDRLADALIAGGAAGGERLWRMPLVEEYRHVLDSDIADISHISRDRKIQAGSITAALFLREFVGGRPWAHLDIAGPARADGDEHEVSKGATGFGTRTLLHWLEAPRPVRRDRRPRAGTSGH